MAMVIPFVVLLAAGCAKLMDSDTYWMRRLDDIDREIASNTHLTAMYKGMTLLMVASSYGNLRAVDKLLINGADPLQETVSNRLCALSIASALGHRNICCSLLKSMDRKDPRFSMQLDQAFIQAVHAGNPTLVELFLENGARVESRDDDGWSVLSYAVLQQDLKVTHLLLKWAPM